MKAFRKIQTKAYMLCMAILMSVLVVVGIHFMPHTASAASNASEIIYIDTEVEDIAFTQHPTCVFFGFRLAGSDYDDFGSWEGDYAHTDTYNKYEQYITSQLTYWKNFSQINSEGARFDQLYAYWSAGWDIPAQAYPLPPTQFANSVAHRSTLARLEFGLTFDIPAGTTFPSATYVKNGCQGTPIMYRTVEDKAFYYDGSKFQTFSYAVSQTRKAALEEVNAIDYDAYQEPELAEVRALVEKVSEKLNVSFTKFAIQDTLSAFYAELDEIMTVADYQELAEKKTTAKSELLAFFNGLEQESYEAADWTKILSIQSEYNALIDALGSGEEVDAAVIAVKFAVGSVMTKAERADFAAYQEAAMQRLEASFVEALYREQEREQGAAWVQEAKTIIEQATTKDAVDSVELTYTARIRELKTQAQWESEEQQQNKPTDSTEKEEPSVEETPSKESGCGSSFNQSGIMLCAGMVAFMAINKKRTKKEMKSKRIIALGTTLLMGITTIGAFSACGGTTVKNDDYDPTKANISVVTYEGGVGYAWLEEAARRFEDKYKDATHFQEGRTGVKINVDKNKYTYSGEQLAANSLTKDVYFTEGVDYYKFVNDNKVADITDVVTEPLSTYGESGTIEDKLDSSFTSFLTAKDDKYYMLPFYDGFYGFIYDVDLFEQEGFYYDKDGDFLALRDESQRETFEENKSNGPDGVHGTYDDGLPATYEELIALADQIVAKSYVPFCYSGTYNDYVNKACRSFIADYEGYERFKMNYTFSGTAELVKEVKADGTVVTEELAITPENGYELQRQAGKYYALKMQEELFGSVKYLGGSWNGFDYTVAQSEFIKSKYTTKRYAMLVEGVWWENEAEPTFTELENIRGEKKSDRRFGLLPMPKVNAEAAGPQTMFSANSSFAFINKNCQNMELAKEFMRFVHTDAEMSKFSAKTSISRSLNYKVSEADQATATHFGKLMIKMREQSKVVYPYSSLNMVINNSAAFTEAAWYLNASVGGKTLKNPFDAFKDGQATAEKYFNGLYNYQSTMWSNLK